MTLIFILCMTVLFLSAMALVAWAKICQRAFSNFYVSFAVYSFGIILTASLVAGSLIKQ